MGIADAARGSTREDSRQGRPAYVVSDESAKELMSRTAPQESQAFFSPSIVALHLGQVLPWAMMLWNFWFGSCTGWVFLKL